MKKYIGILFLCITLLFTGCSNSNENSAKTFEYKCYEYDSSSSTLTNKELLSVYISSNYSVATEENKPHAENAYCLHSFNTQTRSINIYQADKSIADLSVCSNVSENWLVETSIIDEKSKTFIFYREFEQYLIVISITNRESDLDLINALKILGSITNEECYMPNSIRKSVVKGTIEEPANIDDWVALLVTNPYNNRVEPVCLTVNKIYDVNESLEILNAYNEENPDNQLVLTLENGLDWIVFDYSIYFPSNYTEGSNGVVKPQFDMSLCNTDDSSTMINGFVNIYDSVVDISKPIENFHGDIIWINGRGYYKMSRDYTDYKIKILGTDNTLAYIKP